MTVENETPTLRDPRKLFAWLRGSLIAFAVFVVPMTLINVGFMYVSGGDPNYNPDDPVIGLLGLGVLAAALAVTFLFLACIVLTVRITHRMIKNLEARRSSHMKIGPVWAVASYFVPIANLYVPVQVVSQIWDGTFAELEGEPPREARGAIGWWWACWVISNVCDNIGNRLTGSSWFQEPFTPSEGALASALALWTVSGLLSVIGAILMIRLFGALARAQGDLADRPAR